MPKLGEAAQRSERFAFLDFDYGAIGKFFPAAS
jgi:hypothetical protein